MNRKSLFEGAIFIFILFMLFSVAQARGPGQGRGVPPEQIMRKGVNEGQGMGRPHGGKGLGLEKGRMDYCLAGLDLSSEQIAKLRGIREEHLQKMAQIRGDMQKYRAQHRTEVRKGEGEEQGKSEDTLDQIAELWKEREREMRHYREQITTMLTQEQKDKLYMCESIGPKPEQTMPATEPAEPVQPIEPKE